MEGAGSSREFVEGCKLQIKTTLGEDIEGHVLTYDKALNIVVLHILCSLLVIFGGPGIIARCRREILGGFFRDRH
jgi:hypothetical protein